MRLLNPSSSPVSINQDSVIGFAEQYDEIKLLAESEDASQAENNNAVRRIQFMSRKVSETSPLHTQQVELEKSPFPPANTM